MARRKVKNGEKSPWGQCLTRPVPNGRRRVCLLIGQKNTKVFWHQSEARTTATVWNWSGKTLSPGLFSPLFSFLRAISSRPFRLSLAPTICPWVSEDDVSSEFNHLANFNSVMVIVHRSASDRLAVDSLVCIVKLACFWTETLYSPQRVVSGKSLPVKDL